MYPEYKYKYSQFDIEKEYHEDWDKFKMWDLKLLKMIILKNLEAYSMANHPAEGNIINA